MRVVANINQSINVTSLKSNYQGKSLNDKTQNIQQDKFVSFGVNSNDLRKSAYDLACEVERCAREHDYEGGVIAEEKLDKALDKYLDSLSLNELKKRFKSLFCKYYID